MDLEEEVLRWDEPPVARGVSGDSIIYMGDPPQNVEMPTEQVGIQSFTEDFFCQKCGKLFKTKKQVLDHQRAHYRGKPFACDVCEKTFRTEEKRNQHLSTHNRKYMCRFCLRGISKMKNLRKHEREQHGAFMKALGLDGSNSETEEEAQPSETPSQSASGSVNRSAGANNFDNLNSDQLVLTCPECELHCPSLTALFTHMESHVKVEIENFPIVPEIVVNDQQNDVGPSAAAIVGFDPSAPSMAVKTTRFLRLFECNLCERKYEKHTELNSHLSKHRTGKYWCTWECEWCCLFFETRLDLRRHKRNCIVGELKKLPINPSHKQCEYCGAEFKNAAACREHEVHHKKEEIVAAIRPRNHVCSECQIIFATIDDLHAHCAALGHMECPNCALIVKDNFALEVHIGSCTVESGNSSDEDGGQKVRARSKRGPYRPRKPKPKKVEACSYCGVRFAHKRYRTKHEITFHLRENQTGAYQCSLCPRRFDTAMQLNGHRQHHERLKCSFCGMIAASDVEKLEHRKVCSRVKINLNSSDDEEEEEDEEEQMLIKMEADGTLSYIK